MSRGAISRLLLYPAAGILLVLLYGFHWLGFTDDGARFVVNRLGGFLPALSANYQGGTLAGGLRLGNVVYKTSEVQVTTPRLTIRLNFIALLAFRIHLGAVQADDLKVVYKESSAPASSSPSSPVNISTPIDIDDLKVSHIEVRINDAPPVSLASLETTLRLKGETLSLKDLEVRYNRIGIKGAGSMSLNAPFQFESSVRISLAGSDGRPALIANGRINGDQARIDIAASLPSPDDGRLTATLQPGAGRFNASLDLVKLGLARLTGQAITVSDGHVMADGTFDKFRFRGGAAVDNPWLAGSSLNVDGSLDAGGITFANAGLSSKDVSLTGEGRLEFAGERLTTSIRGKAWSRPVDADLKLALGNADSLRAEGRLSMAGNNLVLSSPAPGKIHAKINASGLAGLDPGLSGTVTGTGDVDLGRGKYELALSSRRLGISGQVLRGASGRLSIDPSEGLLATVSADDWRSGSTQLGSVALAFSGPDFSRGKTTLDWRNPDARLKLAADISIAGGEVSGNIERGTVESLGRVWTLSGTPSFNAVAGQVRVDDNCWQATGSQVCMFGISYGNNRLKLELQSKDLQLAGFNSDEMNVRANLLFSPVPDFRVEADGNLSLASAGLAWNGLKLTITGNGQRFSFNGTSALDNPYIANGRISLQGGIAGDTVTLQALKVTGTDIAATVQGQYGAATGKLVATASGKWRGRDIQGDARLDKLNTRPAGHARLSMANNRVEMDVTAAGHFKLALTAPDLSRIVPDWAGSLSANGDIDTAAGRYVLKGSADSLRFGQWRLGAMQIDGTSQDGNVDGVMSLERAQYTGQPLGGGKVTVHGRVTQANLALAMQLPGGDFNLHAVLGINRGALSGHVSDGDFMLGGQQWKLQAPFEFASASGILVVGNNCWQNAVGHICLREAHLAARQGALDVSIARLPVDTNNPWFAPDVSIDGEVNGNITGSVDTRTGKPVFQGTFSVAMPGVKVGYGKGTTVPLDMRLDGNVRDNRLSAELAANSEPGKMLSARLDMPDLLAPGRLSGNASLDTDKIGLVAAFLPQVDKATGSLHAVLQVNSLVEPLKANVDLVIGDKASIGVPLAGVTLTDFAMTAKGDEHRIAVNASATSGQGNITAVGAITDLFTEDRRANIKFTGQNASLLNRTDMKLVATPDVTLALTGWHRLDVKGKFEVEDGSFAMPELRAQARTPSSDVVVVSGGQPTPSAMETSLQLDVTVKKFSVDMYGLESGIEGNVLLTQQGTGTRRAQGTVNLVGGTYTRFGQKFDIDKGRLIFSGPLDNPLVDVVTSRTIATDPNNPVKVSLTLSGPANDIKSTITSDPPMSGANALAYLVLGHPLTASSGTDSQAVSGAALALGLKQALPITRQIQSALGLSQLTVATNGVDSTSVVAGKRIGPNLYVEYDYDVFSRLGGILFNYKLTQRLSLETRTGQANSMQLIYNF